MEIKLQSQQPESNIQLRQIIRSSIVQNNPDRVQQKKRNFNKLPNGYANSRFFLRYARTEYTLAGSTTLSLALIITYMSIQQNSLKDWILYMGFLYQFVCIFVLIINYNTYNQFKVQTNDLHDVKKPLQLFVKIFSLLIRPNPFLQGHSFSFRNQLTVEYHQINHILCLLGLGQIFLIMPSFFVCSKYQSIRSQRISQMYGFKASYVYALKCWFKQNSTFAVTMAFLVWFIVCSFAIRIAEHQNNHILKSFQNSMWLTFITMSTVGLGDLYPLTNVGFVISFIAMYSGVMMISIAIMLLRNIFELSSRQKRTLLILKNLQEKNQLKVVASQFMRQAAWRMWLNRRNRGTGIKENPSLLQRTLKQKFKALKKSTQKTNYDSNLRDEFKHNFDKVYGYMQNLRQNHDRMINFLQNTR